MGLGKTLQAIAVMCYYRSDWPLLVVCPSSVRMSWAEVWCGWGWAMGVGGAEAFVWVGLDMQCEWEGLRSWCGWAGHAV